MWVVVEGGTYGSAMTRLHDIEADYVGVAMDDDGIIPAELEKVLAELKAVGKRCKYIYTIPTVQNPTGTIMSMERRHALLDIAQRHDLMIFEDDCYADLTWSGTRPPAIKTLDTEGRVIYCGSFSKSIAPALRVGYLVADWPFIAQALTAKTDAGSGALEQITLAEFLPAHFDSHVAKLTALFKQKCDAIQDALHESFGTSAEFRPPGGGIFIWVTLPDTVDTSKLAQAAAAAGISINPGRDWVADPEDREALVQTVLWPTEFRADQRRRRQIGRGLPRGIRRSTDQRQRTAQLEDKAEWLMRKNWRSLSVAGR